MGTKRIEFRLKMKHIFPILFCNYMIIFKKGEVLDKND